MCAVRSDEAGGAGLGGPLGCWLPSSLVSCFCSVVTAPWSYGSSFLADLGQGCWGCFQHPYLAIPAKCAAFFLSLRWPSKTSKKELNSGLEGVLLGQFLPCTGPFSRHQMEESNLSQLWTSWEIPGEPLTPDTSVSSTWIASSS